MTGQTGSGQARLTLGGSTPSMSTQAEWSPAERFASGSARPGHSARATRPSLEKQSAPRSRPSAPPAHSSTLNPQRDHRRRIRIQLDKMRSPSKGLDRISPRIAAVIDGTPDNEHHKNCDDAATNGNEEACEKPTAEGRIWNGLKHKNRHCRGEEKRWKWNHARQPRGRAKAEGVDR